MNDRFKFRLFIPDKKNSKNSLTGMFKVHSLHTGTNKAIISSLYGNCSIKLENNILMQCTGLRDKHNKLIYEGDIVRYTKIYECALFKNTDEIIFEVVYDDFKYYLKQIKILQGIYSYLLGLDFSKIFKVDTYTENQTTINLEVIGNIYENAELLESEG